jgi:hypothetical protein
MPPRAGWWVTVWKRRADGPGHQPGRARAHRRPDRRGRARRRGHLRGWAQHGRSGYEKGAFVRPTILDNVQPGSEISRTEIFGPVLSLMHANTIEEAIELVNSGPYGNQASMFTSSGAAARRFRYDVQAGQHGHQHWRGRADGLLPLQRLERQLLRRPARPGHGCGGVLYPEESRGRTLAQRLVAKVLSLLDGCVPLALSI